MQRIIQINLAGKVIPIEEDAYILLRDYIAALGRHFSGPDGHRIIADIEDRISELFGYRLQSGAPAINNADVNKVIEQLGPTGDVKGVSIAAGSRGSYQNYGQQRGYYRRERLLRDPYDKILGGVCSGVAHYFDIDPLIVRIIMVVLFFSLGIGLLAYILAWILVPAARSKSELYYNYPLTFGDVTNNVAMELEDLKQRAEQMSRELKDFFGRKR